MAQPWKNDPVADAPWLRDTPKTSGYLSNLAAGANDVIASTAGLPVDLMTGAMNLGSRGINAVAGTNIPPINTPVGGSASIKGLMGMIGADPREVVPASRGEELARAGAQGAAGAVVPGGIARALPQAAGPALGAVQQAIGSGAAPGAAAVSGAAGVAGNVAEQYAPEPFKPAANMAAQVGAGVGAGLAQRAGGGLLDRFLGVPNITPERAALARRAVDVHGLPLTAPDIQQGSTPMRWLQSGLDYLPGSGAGGRAQALQTAVNRDVGRTIGADTDRVTAGTVQTARAGAGRLYDQSIDNVTMPIDPQLQTGFANVHHDIGISGLATHEINGLRGVIDRAWDAAAKNNGVLPASAYQELRKRGSVLDNMMAPGDPRRPYALKIKQELDQAFARNDPARAGKFRAANERWRAVEAIRPEVKRGAEGDISPLRIQNAANRAYPERDVNPMSPGGHLGELGDIAQTFLRRLPDSGTAPRQGILNALGKLSQGAAGPAMGAAAGMGVGGAGLMPALLGMGGVSAAGNLLNRSVLSAPWLRETLLNRVLNPPAAPPIVPPWMLGSIPAQAAPEGR